MTPPILFSRTATLGSAAASLTLSSIPQTADHLLVRVRARADDVITANAYLGLRLNGDAGPDTYDGNTMKFSTGAAGQADDGIDLEQFILGDVTHSDVAAGIFNEHFGVLPRYAEAEPHALMAMGFSRFDAADGSAGSFMANLAGGQHSVAAAVTSLELHCEGGNLAAGSEITVWGMTATGDVFRSERAAGSLTLDFAADEDLIDVTLTAGVDNPFVLTNPRLGRTLTAFLAAAGAGTTVTLPATCRVLRQTFDPTADAVLVLRCVDEAAPEYLATLSAVEASGGTF